MWDAPDDPTNPLSTSTKVSVPELEIGPIFVVPNPTLTTFIYSSSTLNISRGYMVVIPLKEKIVADSEILPPFPDKVCETLAKAIGYCATLLIVMIAFSFLFAIENSWEFPSPTDVNVTAVPDLTVDIEKLLLLPEKYEKNILFELWYDDVYQSDVLLDMVDLQINKYYVTEKDIVTYEDSIHPILTKCDIVHYKIIEKK